jgi:NAD(P)-dependent dehydrogenase (short-subunit alcohol dehydrogenase family)
LIWYNGTKGAVITITKSMAVKLAPGKIRVNAINPVAGDPLMLAQFLPGEDTLEIRQKFINTIPLGCLSRPLEIARAALFLVSDEAEFITRSVWKWMVDGVFRRLGDSVIELVEITELPNNGLELLMKESVAYECSNSTSLRPKRDD